LLTDQPVVLRRIPHVRDVRTMQRLLVDIGATAEVDNGCVRIQVSRVRSPEAPYELVKTMRASSLVLGPLVARAGRARVSLPGGCAIGARPINLHLAGLEQLGAQIQQAHGYIEAVAPQGLRGATIRFERITVTGTEDLIMAAVLARGETVIENAAREPEVTDLADLLVKMGAQIEGAAATHHPIQGVERGGSRRRSRCHHCRPHRDWHIPPPPPDYWWRPNGDRMRSGAQRRADREAAPQTAEVTGSGWLDLRVRSRAGCAADVPADRRVSAPPLPILAGPFTPLALARGPRASPSSPRNYFENQPSCTRRSLARPEWSGGPGGGHLGSPCSGRRIARDRFRPARQRFARAGGAGGSGRNGDRPCVSHRSRL
jgi:hypothetical protein